MVHDYGCDLGNLHATVHTVSKAALRLAAAGGEPCGSFALPPAHASARHVAPPDLPALDVALVSLRGPEAFVEVRDPTVAGSGPASRGSGLP